MDYDLSHIILSSSGVIIALLSLFITRHSVLKANVNTTTLQFLEFSKRYNSPKMRSAMNELSWYYSESEDKENFAQNWYKDFKASQDSPKARSIRLDQHRRLINRYFSDIARCRRNNLIDKKLAILAGRHYGINVYFKIVSEMNKVMFEQPLNTKAFAKDAQTLKKEIGLFGTGEIIATVPARKLKVTSPSN